MPPGTQPQNNLENNLAHKKEIHPPIFILLIILLAVLAGTYEIYQNLNSTPTPTQQSSDLTAVTDPISDWKTYRNEEYGFEFKYPSRFNAYQDNSEIIQIIRPEDKSGAEGPVNNMTIHLWDNKEKLSINEWWNKYGPYTKQRNSVGLTTNSFPIENMKVGDTDGILIGGREGVLTNYLILSAPKGKILEINLMMIETNQILSTFKFVEPNINNQLSLNEQIKNMKIGDIINGMRVVYIKQLLNRPGEDVWEDNAEIGFSGETTITGEYEYYDKDEAFVGGNICLTIPIGTDSFGKLPLTLVRGTLNWFCFNNLENARQNFGPEGSQGKATVIIDGYISKHCGCEAHDEAKLIKVISKN